MIVSKEEEKVWQDTLKKLSRFGVKEEQVFKMSTTEVFEPVLVLSHLMFLYVLHIDPLKIMFLILGLARIQKVLPEGVQLSGFFLVFFL